MVVNTSRSFQSNVSCCRYIEFTSDAPYVDHYSVLYADTQKKGISRRAELMTRCFFRRDITLNPIGTTAVLHTVKFELELPDFRHTLQCGFGVELNSVYRALISEFGDTYLRF